MSTYFSFTNPITKQELEDLGVNFHADGYIVDEDNDNELHTKDGLDGIIYGFTRYARYDAEYLLDILDDNGIKWVDEG